MADAPATHIVGTDAPRRLDAFLHRVLPGLSRRLVHAVIQDGGVRVNDRPARKGTLLRTGDRVIVPAIGPQPSARSRRSSVRHRTGCCPHPRTATSGVSARLTTIRA